MFLMKLFWQKEKEINIIIIFNLRNYKIIENNEQ
jgi:hypothetical protein